MHTAQIPAPVARVMRTPAAANALLKSEIERWGRVIRDNNIHVDQ